VTDALSTVFSRLEVSIAQCELHRKARERVAEQCISMACDVANMAFPARQTAPTTPITMVHGSWEADPEPVPPSVERWVAGYLQVAVRTRGHSCGGWFGAGYHRWTTSQSQASSGALPCHTPRTHHTIVSSETVPTDVHVCSRMTRSP
jgi:hypothetical protein